ncbi:MAG: Crp/Fnr family transcriptional regulator [Marinilabiliaceae bacterium]|jgi:CRP/FNR family transcriptional regulator|nr:Crp/Fnr family transcriptional regulator [Marinilabiliaceae bacterium]
MSTKNYRELVTKGAGVIPDRGIFNYLDGDEKIELGKNVTYMKFSRHDILFNQRMPSDHAVYLINGLVKVYKGGRGDRLICISLTGPGQFAGLSSVFGSVEYKFSASAIEDSEALMIRREALEAILKNNGRFALELFRIISQEGLQVSEKLVNFSMKQLPGRVADLLQYFSGEVFQSEDFTVPLTRQELAELIGTTKESLIRTLNEFKHDRIIELDGKRIKLLSPELITMLSNLG